jgi:hypothetical protein
VEGAVFNDAADAILLDDIPVDFAVPATNVWAPVWTNSSDFAMTLVLVKNAPPVISLQPTNVAAIAGTNVQFLVAADSTEPLRYQWYFNGRTISKATNTTLVLSNVQPTNAGTYFVRVTNTFGSVTSSNAVLTVIVPDTTKPTTTISLPKSGQRWSNSVFTVIGTARDNVAVSNVWVQLNGDVWNMATGTSNWTASVTLTPGTNTVRVYAVDTSGNVSVTNSVNCVYVQSALMTVQISGNGTVVPNYNGQLLQLGKSFTMTAKAASGSVFSNWMNGADLVLTNGAALRFTMQSNLVLRANFIPNPFIPLAGNYAGLFFDTNSGGITVSNAGYVTAKVTSSGGFTAKLLQGAKSYSLSGQFSVGGGWGMNAIKGATNLGVWLRLGDDEIIGKVSNSVWSAEITANRVVYSGTNPAPPAGQYTLVIPGGDDPATLPSGHGAAAVKMSSAGAVTVSGTLGDQTALTESTFVSKQGQWPLYAAPYSKKGILIGWLTFTNDVATMSDMEGVVSWIKPEQKGTKIYPDGFDWPYNSETNNAFGAVFTNRTPLLSWTNGVVILGDGNLAQSITNGLVIGGAGKVTGTNKLGMTITTSGAKAGLFKGSVVNPLTGKAISINGVVLQKQNVGYGSFLGTNQSGSVYFGP